MTKRYIIAKVDRAVTHPLAHLPAMQPGDSVRVTMRPDGGFDVVPLRREDKGHRDGCWEVLDGGACSCDYHFRPDLWADAPEQGDERPRMMAGLWPKPEGEATHCLADDPDPTEQGDDR